MAGFCGILREESNIQIRENMLDYLINLFDDANDFSWSLAKDSHSVLLCRMEQGEIKSWTETEKLIGLGELMPRDTVRDPTEVAGIVTEMAIPKYNPMYSL